MKFRRIIARSFLCLGLGLATTVAIAWLIAAFLPQRNWLKRILHESFPPPGNVVFVEEFHSTGAVRRVWQVLPSTGQRTTWFRQVIEDPSHIDVIDGAASTHLGLLKWGRLPAVLRSPREAHPEQFEHATGWPFLALWYDLRVEASPGAWPRYFNGGIPLTSEGRAEFAATRALPYRPIPLGLFADTILFTLAWSFLLYVPSATRRRARLRRGLCPACGYDLSGLTPGAACPECGKGA